MVSGWPPGGVICLCPGPRAARAPCLRHMTRLNVLGRSKWEAVFIIASPYSLPGMFFPDHLLLIHWNVLDGKLGSIFWVKLVQLTYKAEAGFGTCGHLHPLAQVLEAVWHTGKAVQTVGKSLDSTDLLFLILQMKGLLPSLSASKCRCVHEIRPARYQSLQVYSVLSLPNSIMVFLLHVSYWWFIVNIWWWWWLFHNHNYLKSCFSQVVNAVSCFPTHWMNIYRDVKYKSYTYSHSKSRYPS